MAKSQTAQVYFGGSAFLATVALNDKSIAILNTLYCDPFTGVFACNHNAAVRALRPFVVKQASSKSLAAELAATAPVTDESFADKFSDA